MASGLLQRFGIYVAIGVAAWAGWQGYGALSAPTKIDAALSDEMSRGERVDIVVDLGFKPEPTHLRIFQEFGAIAGVDDDRVKLVRVPNENVGRIARYYWVRRVRVANDSTDGN